MIKKASPVSLFAFALFAIVSFAPSASADHSWGGYHWAHSSAPLSLKLGDNVSAKWDQYLGLASSDWSASSVLGTAVVAGRTNPKNCRAVSGRVEVCSGRYGGTGWLGIASVWVSGSHITQGTVKLNDTYFDTAKYNTPAWRKYVACQEIGHTFGLDHQDEAFSNANLGTCMDYTNDPSGSSLGQLSNEHPNAHDYGMLESIYSHLDSGTTASRAPASSGQEVDYSDPSTWGTRIREARHGRSSIYERDLGRGGKVFTFVTWAD